MIGALVESPTGALAEGGSLCSQRPHLALPEGGEGASGVYHPPPTPPQDGAASCVAPRED